MPVVADVEIASPDMPNTTDADRMGNIASLGLLGVGVYTEDRWVLIAAVLGTALVQCVKLWADARRRTARNERIAAENATHIEAAANVKIASIDLSRDVE